MLVEWKIVQYMIYDSIWSSHPFLVQFPQFLHQLQRFIGIGGAAGHLWRHGSHWAPCWGVFTCQKRRIHRLHLRRISSNHGFRTLQNLKDPQRTLDCLDCLDWSEIWPTISQLPSLDINCLTSTAFGGGGGGKDCCQGGATSEPSSLVEAHSYVQRMLLERLQTFDDLWYHWFTLIL